MNAVEVLRRVERWTQARCPCVNEAPERCPLCGAGLYGICKAVDASFPRELLYDMRTVLAKSD